jgi:hypothetical protein
LESSVCLLASAYGINGNANNGKVDTVNKKSNMTDDVLCNTNSSPTLANELIVHNGLDIPIWVTIKRCAYMGGWTEEARRWIDTVRSRAVAGKIIPRFSSRSFPTLNVTTQDLVSSWPSYSQKPKYGLDVFESEDGYKQGQANFSGYFATYWKITNSKYVNPGPCYTFSDCRFKVGARVYGDSTRKITVSDNKITIMKYAAPTKI